MFITSVSSKKLSGITAHDYGVDTLLGDKINVEQSVQFITGHVDEVIANKKHPLFIRMGSNDQFLNSIKATPHQTSLFTSAIFNKISSEVYQPLFRGMADVPTKGDQVLLCHFAGVNYYMGPLNTKNNPNYNPDTGFEDSNPNLTDRSFLDSNPLLPHVAQKPMETPAEGLDWFGLGNPGSTSKTKPKLDLLRHAVGDMVFQGRMGSSIRLGSRGSLSNLILSGGKRPGLYRESIFDSTIISMTGGGTIKDNFNITDGNIN